MQNSLNFFLFCFFCWKCPHFVSRWWFHVHEIFSLNLNLDESWVLRLCIFSVYIPCENDELRVLKYLFYFFLFFFLLYFNLKKGLIACALFLHAIALWFPMLIHTADISGHRAVLWVCTWLNQISFVASSGRWDADAKRLCVHDCNAVLKPQTF